MGHVDGLLGCLIKLNQGIRVNIKRFFGFVKSKRKKTSIKVYGDDTKKDPKRYSLSEFVSAEKRISIAVPRGNIAGYNRHSLPLK